MKKKNAKKNDPLTDTKGGVMSANDIQINGEHYKDKAIQPWDYITGNNLGYLEGNVVKYVSRWKDKNGVNDLRKAKHYIEKLIETACE